MLGTNYEQIDAGDNSQLMQYHFLNANNYEIEDGGVKTVCKVGKGQMEQLWSYKESLNGIDSAIEYIQQNHSFGSGFGFTESGKRFKKLEDLEEELTSELSKDKDLSGLAFGN